MSYSTENRSNNALLSERMEIINLVKLFHRKDGEISNRRWCWTSINCSKSTNISRQGKLETNKINVRVRTRLENP